MTKFISAKEFRKNFPSVVDDLKSGDEIVVLKHSKPLFKVIPFEEGRADLLDRSARIPDSSQPDLEEISQIVHKIRQTK